MGSATLRSSAHTLRYSSTRAVDKGPNVARRFPCEIRTADTITYNTKDYDLRGYMTNLLLQSADGLIGKLGSQRRLEDFQVPPQSLLSKKKQKSANKGMGEEAQRTLSEMVENDDDFLTAFDQFVEKVVVPYLKRRLLQYQSIERQDDESTTTFYIQRPPTVRIQPGPSIRGVPAHADATYGHQDGELNFWMPLTDPELTQTDLWAERFPDQGDYEPSGTQLGQVFVFHGSSCRHYVPPNPTSFSRVSLDFRIGVEGFFDPQWKLRGTKCDHKRRVLKS